MVNTKKSIKEYLKLGNNLLLEGKYEEAEKAYQQAIALQPDHPWINCNLGRSLLNQGKIEGAIPYLQKAIELDGNIAEAYYNLGNAFTKQNRFEEAVNAYRQAIELEPDQFLYYHQLGDCLLLQGKYEEAIDSYKKAVQINPIYVWSYYNWGTSLSHLSQWEEAVTVYLKAFKQIPGFSELVSKLAISQSRVSDEKVATQPGLSYLSKLRKLFQSEASRDIQNVKEATFKSTVEQLIFPELDDASFIAWMFDILLKRSAADSEISIFLKHFEKGTLSRASALENILKSQEFSDRSDNIGKAVPSTDHVLLSNLGDEAFVKYLYSTFLRRPADEEGLAACVEALKNNVSRSFILENIITSEEFSRVASQGSTEVAVQPASGSHVIFSEMSDKQFIEYIYVTFLKHLPQ
jgi:tetratricopeptide (TPR) repeat protein